MQKRQIQCFSCHHTWTFEPPIGRREECPGCGRDARICLNCRFYDPGAHHECREEQAEWVKEKDKGNFCSYFDARGEGQAHGSQQLDAKQKLDALFGGAKPQSEPAKGADLAGDLEKFLKNRGRS